MAKRPVVITYGTWDLLHIGHLRILRRARKLAGTLIVAVSTDSFNKEKDKKSVLPYRVRKRVLEALPIVDKVIPEKSWGQKERDIKKYKVDLLVMGEDWTGIFDDLPCEVKYFPRTEGISSTELRKWLK